MTTVINDDSGKLDSLHTDSTGALKVTGGSGGSGGGDASAANQVTQTTKLTSIDGKTPALGQALAAAAVPVVLTALQVTALTPPAAISGFATQTTLAALNTKVANGKNTIANTVAVNGKSGGDEYKLVAASATNTVLGATGASGDYLEGLLVIVATAATAQVQLKDGSGTAFTVFNNSPGAGIGTYYLPFGITSVSGAWQVTTGAGVSVLGIGDFT